MKILFCILYSALALSTLGEEVTNTVIVRVEVGQPTNQPPPLPVPPHIPMSVKMRQAAQEARGKAAPWAQRFIATRVELLPLTQTEDDDNGVAQGRTTFTTNYLVTLAPVTDSTNALAVWGAVKAKTLRVVTQRPTAKGDEFVLYPESSN